MTGTFSPILILAVSLAVLPQAAGGARSGGQAAAKPGSLAMTVVTEVGTTIAGATVDVRGAVDRAGKTLADGTLSLLNLPAGTYRCRISRDGFVTLDKEITIRAGVRAFAEAVLAAAPPPPAPPPPPQPTATPKPAGPPPVGKPGQPTVVSIPDLVDQMLRENQPVVERQIGCSFATTSRLIVLRESLTMHRHADEDEMLYLVAGDASLSIMEKDQNISPGWFGSVPRGASHALTRRGRNPLVVLSVRSGTPCS